MFLNVGSVLELITRWAMSPVLYCFSQWLKFPNFIGHFYEMLITIPTSRSLL